MRAVELNRHIGDALDATDQHEAAMAEAVAAAIIEAADEAARNFKRHATDFLAADGAPARWAPPLPDEILDERKLAEQIEQAIQPHLHAAFDAFIAELPQCINVEAAMNPRVMSDVKQVLSAQQDELRMLADQARTYMEED